MLADVSYFSTNWYQMGLILMTNIIFILLFVSGVEEVGRGICLVMRLMQQRIVGS